MTNQEYTAAEKLADAILKASGSRLRNYTIPKNRADIVAAAASIVEQRDELLELLDGVVATADSQLVAHVNAMRKRMRATIATCKA